jgi:hypoxanthine phosphoribosyltransferase
VRLRLARLEVPAPGSVALPARRFAHPSEEIFANLLDFYRIAWEYEPRSFPLEWGEDGGVTESFTPDFYLPELDLYVELTTMRQSLVTRKNRKIKRLRELYPEVNVQVFYQKDFENLIFKYGLEKTAEMLR